MAVNIGKLLPHAVAAASILSKPTDTVAAATALAKTKSDAMLRAMAKTENNIDAIYGQSPAPASPASTGSSIPEETYRAASNAAFLGHSGKGL